MMNPNQPAAPAAAAPAGADQQQAGPVVCIASQPDGSYLVYPEDQGEDGGQPAKDVSTALQLAGQMLQGGGEPDADQQGGAPDSDADDAAAEAMFQGGFKQARGTPIGG